MTASPVVFFRPISAEQAPVWATAQVRTRLVALSPAPHPVRFVSNPGLATRLPGGGGTVVVVVVGGGTVVEVVDGGTVVEVVDGGIVVVDGGAVVVVGPPPLMA
jgi:hypothetical protein